MTAVTGTAQRTKVVLILLLIVGIFQVASGIIAAVIPIRLANDGSPATVVGWVTSAFSAGFLIGCVVAAPLIGALGATRAIVALSLTSAASALVLVFTGDVWAWGAARGLIGITMAALLVLIEAWLATAATTANRATVFSAYMVLSRLAFVVGQVALAFIDPASAALLAAATMLYVLSPWTSTLIPGPPPVLGRKSGPNLTTLPLSAPAAAAASFTHGLIGATGPALLPIYALARGLPVDQVAILLATIPIGGLIFQFPFSYLSDRYGRRTMMAICAIATALLSCLFLLPDLPGFGWLLVITTLWGGAPAPLYLLAVAHANDVSADDQRVAWSSTLLLLWGIGAALGPIAASVLMEHYGYAMLFAATAIVSATLAVFLGVRKLIRKRSEPREPAAKSIGPAPGASGS